MRNPCGQLKECQIKGIPYSFSGKVIVDSGCLDSDCLDSDCRQWSSRVKANSDRRETVIYESDWSRVIGGGVHLVVRLPRPSETQRGDTLLYSRGVSCNGTILRLQ